MNGKRRDLETTVKAIADAAGLKPRNSFPPQKTLEEAIQANREARNQQLICAVIAGNFDGVKMLYANGADVNARDEKGKSALKWAVFTGRKDIAEFLREKGAKE